MYGCIHECMCGRIYLYMYVYMYITLGLCNGVLLRYLIRHTWPIPYDRDAKSVDMCVLYFIDREYASVTLYIGFFVNYL